MEKTRESDLDEVRRWIVEALDDAKAANILELDIRPLTQIADWMVVASGTSTRHVLALAARLAGGGGAAWS